MNWLLIQSHNAQSIIIHAYLKGHTATAFLARDAELFFEIINFHSKHVRAPVHHFPCYSYLSVSTPRSSSLVIPYGIKCDYLSNRKLNPHGSTLWYCFKHLIASNPISGIWTSFPIPPKNYCLDFYRQINFYRLFFFSMPAISPSKGLASPAAICLYPYNFLRDVRLRSTHLKIHVFSLASPQRRCPNKTRGTSPLPECCEHIIYKHSPTHCSVDAGGPLRLRLPFRAICLRLVAYATVFSLVSFVGFQLDSVFSLLSFVRWAMTTFTCV